jgi:hypothetical protein
MVASGSTKKKERPNKKRKPTLVLKSKTSEKVIDPEESDGEIYKLIRGAPSFVVTRSAKESSIYRPKWLKNDGDSVEGMGYNEPPLPTPYDTYCNPDKVNFFVTLMMKSAGNEKGEYVPKYSKANSGNESSESDSSESSSSDSDKFTIPVPKFNVGDRVKFRRNSKHDAIRRTGIITKVKNTKPDPIQSWDDCKKKHSVKLNCNRDGWFRYEIGTLHEPEPGVWTRSYEFCDEGLIHLLKENEVLDHEDTLHGLQRDDPNLSHSFNQRNSEDDTKPVEQPIKTKTKCRNPKIDEKSDKNSFDWSGRSAKKNESSSNDVFDGTRKIKSSDWSNSVFDKSKTPKFARFQPIPPVPEERLRLTISLVFPGGERERQEYSVNKFLTVQEFKRRLATTLLKTTRPISLFVSPDWKLFNHGGCVSDEFEPKTNVKCPCLKHGSTVRVELGIRNTSQVGETLHLKSPARRGGKSNSSFGKRSDDPEARLKDMKGISSEPVKWYSTHRPRLSPENEIERDRKSVV